MLIFKMPQQVFFFSFICNFIAMLPNSTELEILLPCGIKVELNLSRFYSAWIHRFLLKREELLGALFQRVVEGCCDIPAYQDAVIDQQKIGSLDFTPSRFLLQPIMIRNPERSLLIDLHVSSKAPHYRILL